MKFTNDSPIELSAVIPVFLLKNDGRLITVSNGEIIETKNDEPDNGSELSGNKYTIPDWVRKNAEFGFWGEKIALEYLKRIYTDIKWVSLKSDRYGYDITADGYFFEVKTSQSNVGFELTSHEIKVAYRKADDYYLFFIVLNEKSKTAHGYIIKNPIEQFEISPEILCKVVETETVLLVPDRFSVTVEDFINQQAKIDLSAIYLSLLECEKV